MVEEWTADKVGECLVAAFRQLPNTPIYSPVNGSLRAIHGASSTPLDIIMAAQLILGRQSPGCRKVMTWARARALGGSVRETCREMGWSHSTFERHRCAALKTIAARLNAESGELQ